MKIGSDFLHSLFLMSSTNPLVTENHAERSRSENVPLTVSEQRFRDILLQSPSGFAILDGPDMVIGFANEAMLHLWNKEADVIGKPLMEAVAGFNGESFPSLLQRIYTTGESYSGYSEKTVLLKNDLPTEVYYDYVCHPVLADGKVTGVTVMFTDVTAGRQMDDALQTARGELEGRKRLYETITNNTPDLIYVFDLQHRFTYANEALLAMWGKTWEQGIGKKLLENGYEPWHAEMHEREIDQVVATRQPVRGVVSFPHAVLGKRVYDYIFVPVVNEQGEVEAVAGTTRDITEIRLAEEALKRSREELEVLVEERTKALQRSNEDLQQFAHVSSHDMKEPVRKIMLFANMLTEHCSQHLDKKGLSYLAKITNSAKRVYAMIEGILSYSSFQVTVQKAAPVDLNSILEDIENDFELMIRQKQATIQYQDLPMIEGFPLLCSQLFSNLISNSLKFSREGIPPVILITSQPLLREEAIREKLDRRRAYTKITLQDNGIGFDQQHATRIFQIFSRLNSNDQYEGTGLGLSLCRKIAERHGGFIRANGKEKEGAMFTIILPLQPVNT